MKILLSLEKSKMFWSLLILSVIFFLFRLPSLIEPYWYGDEGIYQVLGMAMSEGRLLYTEIWDNKPPLLYLTYALLQGDQFSARLASLLVGLVTVIVFFFFSHILFRKLSISIITTSVFLFLFATPYLEGNIANAENFILLPITLGGLLMYTLASKHRLVSHHSPFVLLLSIGFLLGIAFLYKIVALFDFVAFFLFLFFMRLPAKHPFSWASLRTIGKKSLPLLAGFLIPVVVTCIYFLVNNAFSTFLESTLISNVGYVGWKNDFIIPQGLLILKSSLLGAVLLALFRVRHSLSKPTLFILLWLSFELFSTFFSQRPYTHYVLMMLPSFCMLLGLALAAQPQKVKVLYSALVIAVLMVVIQSFQLPSFSKTYRYYATTLAFLTGQKSIDEYQTFFDGKTPRDYALAAYIKTHAQQSDDLFLWGDSAQIYTLTQKLPPGRYSVAYHMKQTTVTLAETHTALQNVQPRFIITLPESGGIPFSLPQYSVQYAVDGAVIYERTY